MPLCGGAIMRMCSKEEVIKGCLHIDFKGLLDIRGCCKRRAREHELLKRGCEDYDARKYQLL